MEYGGKYMCVELHAGRGRIIAQQYRGSAFRSMRATNGIMIHSFIRGNTWDGEHLGALQRVRSKNADSFTYEPEDETRIAEAVIEYNTLLTRRNERLYGIYTYKRDRIQKDFERQIFIGEYERIEAHIRHWKTMARLARECEQSPAEYERNLTVWRTRACKWRKQQHNMPDNMPVYVPGFAQQSFRFSPESEKEWALGFIDCMTGGEVSSGTGIAWHSPGIRNFLRGAIGNPINVREAQKVIEGDAPEVDKMKFLQFVDVLKRAVSVLESAAMEKEQTSQYRKAVGH